MSSHADPIWRLDPDAPSAINSVMQQATLIDYPGKMAALHRRMQLPLRILP